jgi:hypothetical protein
MENQLPTGVILRTYDDVIARVSHRINLLRRANVST